MHPELNLALEHGYDITRVTEYHSFDDWGDMFSDYIKHYFALKVSYRGTDAWKDWKDVPGGVDAFIEHNWDVYGIELNRELLLLPKNPAMVSVSKLMINSLWGRLSMGLKPTTTVIVDNLEDFRKIRNDNRYNAVRIDLIGPDDERQQAQLTCLSRDCALKDNHGSNVYVGAAVTSYARAYLDEMLARYSKVGQVMYCDTDSVYLALNSESEEPKDVMGNGLGQWKYEDTYSGKIFASLGPKVKMLLDPKSGDLVVEKANGDPKIFSTKGVRKSHQNQQQFTDKAVRGLLDAHYHGEKAELSMRNLVFKANPDGNMENPSLLPDGLSIKKMSLRYSKRVIQPPIRDDAGGLVMISTLPFGYGPANRQ